MRTIMKRRIQSLKAKGCQVCPLSVSAATNVAAKDAEE
jgi:hypothetical protein